MERANYFASGLHKREERGNIPFLPHVCLDGQISEYSEVYPSKAFADANKPKPHSRLSVGELAACDFV